MRPDLLTLTADDLATLSNRGTVKRVQRDLAEKLLVGHLTEAVDGTVTATWPEAITCVMPPNTPLAQCGCNCPAVGVCRHLVQTVLYYQIWYQNQARSNGGTTLATEPSKTWNPGAIADEILARHYRKPDLAKLRKQFNEPHVIELVRGPKPLARFHTLPIVVRFLVPDDLLYTICNCAEAAPCSHVALAVWAFRLLPEAAVSGIIQTSHETATIPVHTLDEILRSVSDLLQLGISGLSAASIRQMQGLIRRAQDDGLIWPAQIISEIAEELGRYHSQDARFSAVHIVELIGELVLRCRAIRNPSETVPAIFIRGSSADNITNVGTARLTGLGCDVTTRRNITQLSVYMVDADTGGIVVIQREFVDPKPDDPIAPRPFIDLARATIMRDSTWATIGTRQLLVKGGKRTAEGVFVPGRAAASVMPGAFNWETLRPPLLADSFAESRARRVARPPQTLSSRRLGEDLAVFAIRTVERVVFEPHQQALLATVRDSNDEQAVLIHPYTSRGSEGINAMAWWLEQKPATLRFVSGHVRRRGALLTIAPVALIFEDNGQRQMVQPWIDRSPGANDKISGQPPLAYAPPADPLSYFPEQITALLSELFLTGVQRADLRTAQQWHLAAQQGHALGFVRLVEPINALASLFDQRHHRVDWDWRASVPVLLNLAALFRFAQEEL